MKPTEFIGQLELQVKREKVDSIDRKIMYLLSLNARISNSTIARHLNLSRESVAYRIKRLQDLRILNGFLTLINAQKTGLMIQLVGIKLNNPALTNTIIEYLKKVKAVTSISHCGGKFDLIISILGKNNDECYFTFQELLSQYHTSIKEYHIFSKLEQQFVGLKMLVTDEKERHYLEKVKETKGSSFQNEFLQKKEIHGRIELDTTDQQLLHLLKNNARLPLTELSKRLHIGAFQIQSRIQRLIRQDVITGFVPYFSLIHLGLQFNYIFLNVRKETEEKFKQWVREHPYVVWYSRHLGAYNYKLSTFVRDNAHLSELLEELHQEFEGQISQIETLPVFKKVQYFPY